MSVDSVHCNCLLLYISVTVSQSICIFSSTREGWELLRSVCCYVLEKKPLNGCLSVRNVDNREQVHSCAIAVWCMVYVHCLDEYKYSCIVCT